MMVSQSQLEKAVVPESGRGTLLLLTGAHEIWHGNCWNDTVVISRETTAAEATKFVPTRLPTKQSSLTTHGNRDDVMYMVCCSKRNWGNFLFLPAKQKNRDFPRYAKQRDRHRHEGKHWSNFSSFPSPSSFSCMCSRTQSNKEEEAALPPTLPLKVPFCSLVLFGQRHTHQHIPDSIFHRLHASTI